MPTVHLGQRSAYFPVSTGEISVSTGVRIPSAGGLVREVTRVVGTVTEYAKGGPWRVCTPDGRDLGEFPTRPAAAFALIAETGDDAAALVEDIERIQRETEAREAQRKADEEAHDAAVANARAEYGSAPGLPDLPLPTPPEQYGSWPSDFADLVDAYSEAHAVSRSETFRRIARITGNSPAGLSLRYYG